MEVNGDVPVEKRRRESARGDGRGSWPDAVTVDFRVAAHNRAPLRAIYHNKLHPPKRR